MRREMICVTCPLGCPLVAEGLEEGELSVRGNRCPRGAAYAREELLTPKRVVTATCKVFAGGGYEGPRRAPCRSVGAFPRERVSELLALIYALEVELPVKRGDILIRDALGTGMDVVATRSLG